MSLPIARRSRIAVLAAALVMGACAPNEILAVGAPGGVFQAGAGCSVPDLEAGGPQNCPSRAQFTFEQPTDDAVFELQNTGISRRQISCRRSYCGTGSFMMHADYRWKVGVTPTENEKLGQIRHRFPTPVDLFDKTVTFNLYIDGPTTPVNAFIAVIHQGRFRMVQDEPVYVFRKWTQRGAALRQDNAKLELPPGLTSLPVTELLITIYLATDVRAAGGDREHWSADLYIDDVGWN